MTIPQDNPATRPPLILLSGQGKRFRRGHPWVFSNEIAMTAETKALPPGSLVTVTDAGSEKLGTAYFNPRSLIAARLLDRDPARAIDGAWMIERLERALKLREKLFDAPYYRLVHAEADGLPGLIVDRYGDVLAIEANTAGAERLLPLALEVLEAKLKPRAVVLDNESAARQLEGLPIERRLAAGTLDGPVTLQENGLTFFADPLGGQKTGWFFDQRPNRRLCAGFAKDQKVLDAYCYAGGFAVQAAAQGAAHVVALDRSEPALALVQKSAEANGLSAKIETRKAEVFTEMTRMAEAQERFGLVIADPPAFVKSKKDLGAGIKGYRKLAKLAASLVAPEGFLFIASCSHHVDANMLAEQLREGLASSRRDGRILYAAGAGPDHPVHPQLPESAYLKGFLAQLD